MMAANDFTSAIYTGVVSHTRLAPKPHKLAYRVFALLLDVDEIDAVAASSRLFSRNRFNALSFHDRDHAAGDAASVGDAARRILAEAGLAHAGERIRLLCYPRILGYGFNPLSVYFCHDRDNRLAALIYEVTNTFRERRSYLFAIDSSDCADAVLTHDCRKQLYVSPFTSGDGRYSFHIRPPDDDLLVGIALRDASGPVLKTHFKATREPLTAATLRTILWRYPLMTMKVIGAIHVEAARLWAKRIPVVAHPATPRFAVTHVRSSRGAAFDDR